MEINLILAIILGVIFIIILPSIAILVFINNKHILKILSIIAFILFIILLSVLVFGKVSLENGNIVLKFQTNNKWFSMYFLWGSFTKSNILLNIVMLLPVGAFILCLNTRHGFIKTILLSLLISVVIEVLQFILPIQRTTEVLDLVLNTVSGIIGYAYFYFVFKLAKQYEINLLNQ